MATLGVRLMASFALAAIGHAAFAGPGQAMEATTSSPVSSSPSSSSSRNGATIDAEQRVKAEADARQQEVRQRNQLKERYSADPALNPWGKGSARPPSSDAPGKASATQQEK